MRINVMAAKGRAAATLFMATLASGSIASEPAEQTGQPISIVCKGTSDTNFAQVFFKSDGKAAQVKIPATLWDVKDSKWLPVQDFVQTSTTLTGRFTLSALTKPRIFVDRVTGMLNIASNGLLSSGLTFSGSCEPYEESARKF